MRNCLAKTTLALWCSVLAVLAAAPPARKPASKKSAAKSGKRAAPKSLAPPASLVRAYRDAPTPAHRNAVESYANAHAKDASGALARLGLGIAAYQQMDYATALASLKTVRDKLPKLADYTGYYLAATRAELKDAAGLAEDLAPARSGGEPSPLAAKSWLLEARALKTTAPAEGIRVLREHYPALPQPEGDLRMADCYQASSDLPRAAEFYQRVYYQYLTGDAANLAAGALVALRDAMGAAYPQPSPQLMLRRADKLTEIREYAKARAEYAGPLAQIQGLEGEQARVRIGAADYFKGKTSAAATYLRGLGLAAPEADAERWYYLEECARRMGDDEAMMAAVKALGERHPKSQWRLGAVISAANRYLLVNRADAYIPLYKAAYQDFPNDPGAGTYHWKVAFRAYLEGQSGAEDLLREHLRLFPGHATAGAALYFLGRGAERANDFAAARTFYLRLAKGLPNTYYAVLARARLLRGEVAAAGTSEKEGRFLATIAWPAPKPLPAAATPSTVLRIERSRLLRTAGLGDLADAELRFGARNGSQPALLAMEMAGAAEAPHLAMRIMKSMSPEYLTLPLDAAPRPYWDLLYPLPYRNELTADAQERHLDASLLAGLIRQESEFNPQALSQANAYGLTQVRPSTGRLFARKSGVARFSTSALFGPALNLKLGSTILRSMLDENGGNVEQTLASYNAGPNRVLEWLGWQAYREPAEFVESIPFTETRDYVQAVLRNADMYRRLYTGL
jgi:soluble lytic murein transglycosylase